MRESWVFPVETDLPDEQLGLLGCGVTSGMGAVFNAARVEPGSSVAVLLGESRVPGDVEEADRRRPIELVVQPGLGERVLEA